MEENSCPLNTPLSLYNIVIKQLSCNIRCEKFFKNVYRDLPSHVLFDLYYQMYQDNLLVLLRNEFSNIEIFSRLLSLPNRKVKLLQCFQLNYYNTNSDLITSYSNKCATIKTLSSDKSIQDLIDTGLRLGVFFSESGWFVDSAQVLYEVESLCTSHLHLPFAEYKLLDCYHRLLHVQAVYCMFDDANNTVKQVLQLITKLRQNDKCPNVAGLYTELSVLHFIRSEYDKAYHWGVKALEHVDSSLPSSVIIDVLRQASKACVVKRKFKKAYVLIRYAVNYTYEIFEDLHPKVADVLMDYGFYLLNSDSILSSVKVYEEAIEIRKQIFQKDNLKIAEAHEDIAYAVYVNEYTSGRFRSARDHAEEAIKIMEALIPSDHLILASAKRVKALILEEIALDLPGVNSHSRDKMKILKEAEDLHLAALKISLNAFGEKNVQTAKHYGNLGRLYQSMTEYEKAERMHLRAISVKEELLGDQDYEVALSIGHLASLYNYHMEKYREAEKLYLRSIAISLKLFGESYSGLEYDYRGLVHAYTELNEIYRMIDYSNTLSNWMELREQIVRGEDFPIRNNNTERISLQETLNKFFSMS